MLKVTRTKMRRFKRANKKLGMITFKFLLFKIQRRILKKV